MPDGIRRIPFMKFTLEIAGFEKILDFGLFVRYAANPYRS